MRIRHIITALDCSSTTQQLKHLSRGLAGGEFQSHVVVLNRGGQCADAFRGREAERLRLPRWFALSGLTKLNDICRRFQPNVLHTWDLLATRYAQALRYWIKTTSHVVEQSGRFHSPRFLPAPLGGGFRTANTRFVFRTNAACEKWRRSGGAAESCRVIYPFAPDTPSAESAAFSREECRQRRSLTDKDFVVATVGRLDKHRRLKDVIWATDMLKFYGARVHLLVFGAGPLRWRCEKFAHQCEIADRVHFMGERSDIMEWLPHCDLLWQADDVAGSGTALVEAMTAGLPVVATDLPGHREFVVPEETGLLLPVGRRADFAAAAARLLNDPALARRWGEAGRVKSRRDFSPDVLIQRYRDLYGEFP